MPGEVGTSPYVVETARHALVSGFTLPDIVHNVFVLGDSGEHEGFPLAQCTFPFPIPY